MDTRHITTPRKQHQSYCVWKGMNRRCYDPKSQDFPNYGGRGITVCDRWRSDFLAFDSDMGPRPPYHSIERKNNNGPYSPDNCVWANRYTQGANKRNNLLLTYKGETRHLNEWARRFGIPRLTLRVRLMKLHWPLALALEQPVSRIAKSTQHWLTYRGDTQTVSEWARRFKLTNGCLTHRLAKGWSTEAALTTPVK